jgi:hypothetical protein
MLRENATMDMPPPQLSVREKIAKGEKLSAAIQSLTTLYYFTIQHN